MSDRGLIWIVRAWLLVLTVCGALTLMALLSGCASIQTSDCIRNEKGTWTCADKPQVQEWKTNYQHFNDIRAMAKSCPKGTSVRFTLNDGSRVYGELLRYEGATDYIWYQPRDTGRNWFAQDAFDVHEILRLDVFPANI